jgi:hypothetical protein
VESLQAVAVSHFGYDGEVHVGKLVVAEDVAEDMVTIMSRLFEAGFPIERMESVDAHERDDDLSMAANKHERIQLPPGHRWVVVVGAFLREPDRRKPPGRPVCRGRNGAAARRRRLRRSKPRRTGMIHDGDQVVQAFSARGWIW